MCEGRVPTTVCTCTISMMHAEWYTSHRHGDPAVSYNVGTDLLHQ